MTKIRKLSYEEIQYNIVHFAKNLKEYNNVPDVILAIPRGGLIPATMMSHVLNVPVQVYTTDFLYSMDETRVIKFNSVLLVDDIYDSGTTISDYLDALSSSLLVFNVLSIYTVVANSPICYHDKYMNCLSFNVRARRLFTHIVQNPDQKDWISFPWEQDPELDTTSKVNINNFKEIRK